LNTKKKKSRVRHKMTITWSLRMMVTCHKIFDVGDDFRGQLKTTIDHEFGNLGF